MSAREFLGHINAHTPARRAAAAAANGWTLWGFGFTISGDHTFGLTEEGEARFPVEEVRVRFDDDVKEYPAPSENKDAAPGDPVGRRKSSTRSCRGSSKARATPSSKP